MEAQDLSTFIALVLATIAAAVSAPIDVDRAAIDQLRSAPALFPESAAFAAALGQPPEMAAAP